MRAGASTPLYEACVWPPRPQLVSLLLGHCSADSRTVEGGWTALMAAAEHDNLEALELLLEASAPDLPCISAVSPLYLPVSPLHLPCISPRFKLDGSLWGQGRGILGQGLGLGSGLGSG